MVSNVSSTNYVNYIDIGNWMDDVGSGATYPFILFIKSHFNMMI